MNKYAKWIVENYPTPESARTQCEIATKNMVAEFPELQRVRGMISVKEPYDLPPTKTTHWWCVNVYGYIIDPTGHQYPTFIMDYFPVDESKGEPTGKCPNCGDLCYEHNYFCSDKCNKSYMKYLKDGQNENWK